MVKKIHILSENKGFCRACWDEHNVKKVKILEEILYKGKVIEVESEYMFCDVTGEYWETKTQTAENQVKREKAYKLKGY